MRLFTESWLKRPTSAAAGYLGVGESWLAGSPLDFALGFGSIAANSRRTAAHIQIRRQPAFGLGLFEIGAHCPNMARIARSRLARISTHLARSSGSHTNRDTLVGMPFSSV